MITAKLPLDRARAYLAKCPPAVEGQRGHDTTIALACALVRNFGHELGQSQIWQLLCEWNRTCLPPWSEKELQHKFCEAHRLARPGENARLWQPAIVKTKPKIDPATAIENFLRGFQAGEADLWEASPLRPDDDWKRDAITMLEALYQKGERLNVITAFQQSKTASGSLKCNPIGCGETLTREKWLERISAKGVPEDKAGAWLRMNPLDGRGVADANITAFRFALLECDSVPLNLQLSLFCKLPLPIAAIVTSGGRSLHAWVKVDADDVDDYRNTVSRLLQMLARFGVDPANKNPSRLARLPGAQRIIGATGDGIQKLLYLNPNPRQAHIL